MKLLPALGLALLACTSLASPASSGPSVALRSAPVRILHTPIPVERIAFRCEGKTTCGEMDSCAEARFYLKTCGVKRLDGDGDGVPCEKLCR